MRNYKADLSRRCGPIFSEMAARAASLGPYAAPLATTEGLLERWNRLRAEDASHAGPAQPVTEPAQPATERYFTVVYKLTDANVAKYLSNRDWITYVYADSMAELANLKELSAEPAAPAQAGWCQDCNPDNCCGCATPAAGARA